MKTIDELGVTVSPGMWRGAAGVILTLGNGESIWLSADDARAMSSGLLAALREAESKTPAEAPK